MYTVYNYIEECVVPPLKLAPTLNSSSNTTTPTWPRTDLQSVRKWDAFEHHITAFCNNVLKTTACPLRPPAPRAVLAINEIMVQSHADVHVLSILQELAPLVGIQPGYFVPVDGNKSVVADPDRIWVSGTDPFSTCKSVLEFKTPWSFACKNMIAEYLKKRDKASAKVVKLIHQLYGYMSFNHQRFGVISTFDNTWFCRRVDSVTGGVLEIAGPYTYMGKNPYILEAYLAFLLLVDEQWFYASPTSSPAPQRKKQPIGIQPDRYLLQPLDINDLHFIRGRDRSRVGVVVEGTIRGRDAIFKCVDKTKHADYAAELERETKIYQHLEPLQGGRIPNLFGFVTLWGILDILVLEPAGIRIEEEVCMALGGEDCIKQKMKEALREVHSCGVLHGDVRLQNFLWDGKGAVRVIDFGQATLNASAEQYAAEMRAVDDLEIIGE
ncbi:hypothetical protein HK104_004753 [Borealophlyctis nickersoniae]|nr:hypothetical protein HK104_004753 [Borealophlyctis nickersoniae]